MKALFQMIMPNGKSVYGSASTTVLINEGTGYCYTRTKYSQVIYITKTHMKALDQPSQPCNNGHSNINTSICIARYLEEKLGCNPMTIGSQFSSTPKCTTKAELLALANASRQFEDADENDIFEMTGCLPSCIKDQYSLTVDPLKERIGTHCAVQLDFMMLDSSYKEEEQYIIYDVSSFIADVGGYMGLLLGSSLLSLYVAIENYIRKLLCSSSSEKIPA